MNNVNDILSVLNDHGFSDTSLTTKLAFLNDTIADFAGREPWPFLETEVTLTFDGTNPKPSNFPANFRATLVVVDPSTGLNIQPFRLDTLEKEGATLITMQGDPLAYYFLAGELRFAPIPGTDFTARMRYLQFHPEVTADSDSTAFLIPKRFWMALVFGTLTRLYDLEDDPELSARFEQHYEQRIQTARNELWQRQFDRPDAIQVTDDDYFDLDFPTL